MCQKSSYERRCEDCHMRVIISVVTHQVCGGKPREKLTKAQEEKRKNHKVPYRKDDFICKLRIRPQKKYWSYIGAHTCMRCSFQKLKKEAEEELKALVDGNGMESEINLKKERLKRLKEEMMDTGLPPKDYKKALPKAIEVNMKGYIRDSIEYLFKESLEADQQSDDSAASSDPLPTSTEEPSSHAAGKKTEGKEVATSGVGDVLSDATRSSPFLDEDQMRILGNFFGVGMGGIDSDEEVMETDDQPPTAGSLADRFSNFRP
ncbi:hypothetical protein FOXB_11896 [Fusarium oxysporum f. sp. conglutinans Fo5176]|uniref:Uncharacterized protein n=2 Tax=Fusarium oxysporum f. sp. conglutinans TaxID=100902 RepID=F9FZR4_FUSOF|nr:hypothetical protein FOXB_11896 [Fusarium oxysporum f. sp. conglutinans Fo5176]